MRLVLQVRESRRQDIGCSGSQPWPRDCLDRFSPPLLSPPRLSLQVALCSPLLLCPEPLEARQRLPKPPGAQREASEAWLHSLPCAPREGSPVTSSSGDTAGRQHGQNELAEVQDETSSVYTLVSSYFSTVLPTLYYGFCPHLASGKAIHSFIHSFIHLFIQKYFQPLLTLGDTE